MWIALGGAIFLASKNSVGRLRAGDGVGHLSWKHSTFGLSTAPELRRSSGFVVSPRLGRDFRSGLEIPLPTHGELANWLGSATPELGWMCLDFGGK